MEIKFEFLICNNITDYLTEDSYNSIWDRHFKEFSGYNIQKISKAELLRYKMKDTNNKPNQFWYISIPILLSEEGL